MRKSFQKAVMAAKSLLKHGATPEKIALCVALGVTLSVFPVIVVPTVLCTVFALVLRLNLPLMLAVNVVALPLQWLLLLPFVRIGDAIFRAPPFPISPGQFFRMMREHPSTMMGTVLHASTAWLIASPFLTLLIYAVMLPIVRKTNERRRRAAPQTATVAAPPAQQGSDPLTGPSSANPSSRGR